MSQRRMSDCSCEWTTYREVPSVPVMSKRNRSCVRHGDHTDWWSRIQARAADLGGEARS